MNNCKWKRVNDCEKLKSELYKTLLYKNSYTPKGCLIVYDRAFEVFIGDHGKNIDFVLRWYNEQKESYSEV